jgi:hypothetical protein
MSRVSFSGLKFLNARRTLTPDELKHIAALPVTMIPGKPRHLNWVINSLLRFKPGTTPYVVGTGNFVLNYRHNPVADSVTDPTGIIDSLLAESGFNFASVPFFNPGDDLSLLYGEDIILKNTGAEFTDGDGEVTYDVQYIIMEPLR